MIAGRRIVCLALLALAGVMAFPETSAGADGAQQCPSSLSPDWGFSSCNVTAGSVLKVGWMGPNGNTKGVGMHGFPAEILFYPVLLNGRPGDVRSFRVLTGVTAQRTFSFLWPPMPDFCQPEFVVDTIPPHVAVIVDVITTVNQIDVPPALGPTIHVGTITENCPELSKTINTATIHN
jgi:hypothetical protein